MVKPVIVGAHYGFRDWLAQRVTAVVMALYTVIFAISALMLPDGSYESWRGLFSGGFMKFATFLFFMSCSTTPGLACVTSSWTTSSRPACAWSCIPSSFFCSSAMPAGLLRFSGGCK
jgi:hypothetical protein